MIHIAHAIHIYTHNKCTDSQYKYRSVMKQCSSPSYACKTAWSRHGTRRKAPRSRNNSPLTQCTTRIRIPRQYTMTSVIHLSKYVNNLYLFSTTLKLNLLIGSRVCWKAIIVRYSSTVKLVAVNPSPWKASSRTRRRRAVTRRVSLPERSSTFSKPSP